jgi:cytochrome P450
MSSLAVATAPRFNPFDRHFRADPYPFYHALRENDPVHREMGMWVLTRYSDVIFILRDQRFLSGLVAEQINRQADRLHITDYAAFIQLAHQSIVFTDNPQHTRLRRLVGSAFAPHRLASFEAVIHEVVDGLVSRALVCGELDAVEDFAEQIPLGVMCRKLDIDPSMSQTIGRWTREIRFLLEPGLLTRSDFAQVRDTLAEYTDFLHGLIAERRRKPGEDLISEWLAARVGPDQLVDEEIVHACMLVFVAGNVTTKSLIGNGIAALIDHPDQLACVRQKPERIGNAVLEVLRWSTPTQLTKRLASEPVAIGGKSIGAGDVVLLCLGAANRDPTQFPDPDRFDVERDTSGQLGFGFGMHACLGGRVAQRETAAALGALLASASRIEAGSTPRVLQESEINIRGYARLPISLSA